MSKWCFWTKSCMLCMIQNKVLAKVPGWQLQDKVPGQPGSPGVFRAKADKSPHWAQVESWLSVLVWRIWQRRRNKERPPHWRCWTTGRTAGCLSRRRAAGWSSTRQLEPGLPGTNMSFSSILFLGRKKILVSIFTSCSISPSGARLGAVTLSVTGSWIEDEKLICADIIDKHKISYLFRFP